MGRRIQIPLWVSLPCVAVSVVALGTVATGAVGITGARGYLTRQTDSNLLVCAGGTMGQRLVDWSAPGPAPSGACDTELLGAGGQVLALPAPGTGPGPVIPVGRAWLAAHLSTPVTVPGTGGSWRVLLEAVHYQPQRILYVYGPDDVQYVISGRTGRGPAGLLVVMARTAGLGRLTAQIAASYAAAAGAVLVLLAVAGLALTRAVLRPLREAARFGPFAPAVATVSERMDASRATEAAARRSMAEMAGRLSEVSQELRTSVSIVRGFAESCRQPGKPRPTAGDPMMRRVADEITRMETLVARLDADPPHAPPDRSASG
jgi:signal transduction histidine kinase